MSKFTNPYQMSGKHYTLDDYTWSYPSYSRTHKKTMLCFQWMRYQGSEFCVECETKGEAVKRLKKIAEHFGITVRRYVRDANSMYAVEEFEIETTEVIITPKDVREILGDDVVINVTFKSLKTNKAMRVFEKYVDTYQYYSNFYEINLTYTKDEV